MELLLNCLWLMLALPAIWLWRRAPHSCHESREFNSGRCLIALACLLILLFPVISATDDLHAARAEMEESNSSKRALKQSAGEKGVRIHYSTSPPQLLSLLFARPNDEMFAGPVIQNDLAPEPGPLGIQPGRAPPSSFLAY